MQPKAPAERKFDVGLERVSEALPMSDRNAVALEWKEIDDPQIAGFIIYRGEPGTKLTEVGVTGSRFNTHYVDTNGLLEGRQYIYRISSFTADGRESDPSLNVTANTISKLEPVGIAAGVSNLPKTAKLIFRPHPNERVNGYRIERRDKRNSAWKTVGTLKGRLNAEFIDTPLEDATEYEYRVIVVSHDNLESLPSETVRVTTKQRPPTVGGLTATTDISGAIKISWTRLPNDAKGFYRLYASSRESGGYGVIDEIRAVGSAVERFEMGEIERFYKVTFVDRDGLESSLQDQGVRGAALPER
ncbi:MAG: hypothetical protein LBE89_02720 [Helicobacteraceae bacterium]|jgi:fibronectin type 3 domain-containing protein|nr:hypothetical protein [Helicobacteraceae bacterium]